MNWIGFQRIFTQPMIDRKIKDNLNRFNTLRSTDEVVNKLEEFKFYLNKLVAKKEQDKNEVLKYSSYIELLEWVLNADKSKNRN